jgi:exopolysaccharide biosynthesis polyprenyl glycosylphosphotransferase
MENTFDSPLESSWDVRKLGYLRKLSLLMFDMAGIILCFYFNTLIRGIEFQFGHYIFLCIAGILLISFYILDLYRLDIELRALGISLRIFMALLLSFIGIISLSFVLGVERWYGQYFGRGIMPLSLFSFGIYTFGTRAFAFRSYSKKLKSLKLLLIGKKESFENFFEDLKVLPCEVSFSLISDSPPYSLPKKVTYLDDINYDTFSYSGVVFNSDAKDESLMKQLMALRLRGVRIYTLSDFYEIFWFKVPINDLKEAWFAINEGFHLLHSKIGQRLKRAFDIFLSLVILIISFPICLLTGILITLTDKGPIFYTQWRKGLAGENFKIFKFRSMRVEAEKNGAVWASKKDDRITWIGNIIRKTRIDEIPQVLNVFKGDMSFIGPRPERPEFTQMLEKEIPFYDLRHLVKPGITGWAQVNYPYGASVEDAKEKLMYDIYYIKNFSIFLDLSIVLKTIRILLLGKGR